MTQQTFSVWAPSAERVGLWHDGTVTPMSRDGQWWSAVADVDPGSGRYGYVLDGDDGGSAGDVLPDPRAPRLPDGVHAAGAVDDATAFGWTDQTWAGRPIAGAVIYELHIGTFTPDGTFDAAIDRLAYLADLGVEFVEVMPVNGFNGVHNWGYDGVAWYAVHEPYGGPEGFRRFVDAAHAAGIGVILDVVYNHLGPSGNYLPRFGPYLTEGANTWGQSLNLDQADSDAVRAHIIDNALRWMRDFHVDGLRLDAVHALVDHTAIHLLEELAVATDALATALGRPLSLIAESDLNDPRLVTARGDGGYGLAAQWDDDVHHAIHTTVSGERQGYYADFGSLDCLATALTRGFFHAMTYSSFRRRRHGRPIDPDRVAPSQMVVYTCDHDQIGNRAIGDRPSAYLDHGQLAIKAALVLTSAYTPMLFMGEEWGASTPFQFFTSHPEPELGKATAEGRKAEFADHGWDAAEIPDPQDPETFQRSKLDWSEPGQPDHARVLDFYRALISLRRSVPDLTDDRWDSVSASYDVDRGWFALHRGAVSTICVLGGATTVPIAIEPLLAWEPVDAGDSGLASPGHNVVVGRRLVP